MVEIYQKLVFPFCSDVDVIFAHILVIYDITAAKILFFLFHTVFMAGTNANTNNFKNTSLSITTVSFFFVLFCMGLWFSCFLFLWVVQMLIQINLKIPHTVSRRVVFSFLCRFVCDFHPHNPKNHGSLVSYFCGWYKCSYK